MAILGVLLLNSSLCHAQKEEKDSIYYKIENYSKKSQFRSTIYGLIFRQIPDTVYDRPKPQINTHSKYQNYVIRKINTNIIDPFGSDEKNLGGKKIPWYENLADELHMKTRKFVVESYLFFKPGQKLNAQKLYESARLLRSTNFISHAEIYPIDSTSQNDSVDISVKVQDAWSFRPRASVSSSNFGVGLTEYNFLGLGHQLNFDYRHNFKDKTNFISGSYYVNNIYNTYIQSSISAYRDYANNERIDFNLFRNFFSPLAKWAGGFQFTYFKQLNGYPTQLQSPEVVYAVQKALMQNFWVGYQIPIFLEKEKPVTDNMSFAFRFQNFANQEPLPPAADPNNFNSNYSAYLFSLGYTQRKFAVQRYIFRYNLDEDVPYGKILSITTGALAQNGLNMPYFGVTAGYGALEKWGYFNGKFQYGTLLRETKNYRGAFRLDFTYFTPLIYTKFAKMRVFLSPTWVIGKYRDESLTDRTNLSNQSEFPLYNPNYLGHDKLVIRSQLQMFINKPWKNFYFSPYLAVSFGWLSTENSALIKSKLNSKFILGFLLYNPYLTFSRLQFSFAYYPSVPFDGNNVFKFNEYKNNYLPINQFSLAMPEVVQYSR